jgi:DNA transformation protein
MQDELLAWSRELLAPLGAVRSRRMFGGHGLYVDEVFIALIAAGTLYLKVDDATQVQFEQAGCQPFRYGKADGSQASLRYFNAPEEALESPPQMLPWARLAMASALRARASKPPARPRAKPAVPRKVAPRKRPAGR